MLPGFNNKEQYMALEGFITSQHNRSDEAFTIADLEEFETANNMKLSTDTASNNMTIDNIGVEEDSNNVVETTRPAKTTTTRPAKTTTTRPAKTTTTRPAKTTTTRPAKTTTTPVNKKKPKKTTTTTKMVSDNDIMMGDEDDFFKDLEPTSEQTIPAMDNTENEDPEMEDPEMEDPEIEDDTDMTSDNTISSNKEVEGFTGSRLINEKWLNSLLKTLLLTFIVYVVIHPGTSKVLSHFIKKSGLARDLIVCVIFFIICYIIIISF